MPTLEEQYQQLIKVAKDDNGVKGLILGGSRGKGIPTTEQSDYDILIIADDAVIDGLRIKYKGFASDALDINVRSERELAIYGVWGSDTMWARYGFAHVKAVLNKTGQLQHWLDEQEQIPAPAQDDAIKQSLDGYLNYTHRSLKSLRDGRAPAAHMAACDAMPLLITFVFAAEGRVRPYNEYIEWELSNHPLHNLPVDPTAFTQKIGSILANGNEAAQKDFLKIVQGIALKSKVGTAVLNSWDGYYFG
jgi:hypothetical protein